jgi:hypothetical protein
MRARCWNSVAAIDNRCASQALTMTESPSEFFVKEVDAPVTFIRNTTGAVTALVLHPYGQHHTGVRIR